MWRRFTDRARQAILLAQEEARDMGESGIGTQHVLLGLLRTNEFFAARVLQETSLDLPKMRSLIAKELPARGQDIPEELELCLTTRRLIELDA